MRLEELVNRHYDQLNSTDRMIWKYVYNNKNFCINCSINELAEKCNVSRTTIMRFAQKLSLSGYSELKLILKGEREQRPSELKNQTNELCELYQHIIQEIEKRIIQKSATYIQSKTNFCIWFRGFSEKYCRRIETHVLYKRKVYH